MAQILIFGASIAWGAWDTQGGWAQRLKQYVDENNIKHLGSFDFNWTYPLGIPGDSSTTLLERVEQEMDARCDEGVETVVLFEVGTNDSLMSLKDGTNATPLNVFKKNLEELILAARKYQARIVFVGLPPVDEDKMNPTPHMQGFAYTNESLKEYNNSIKQLCDEQNLNFVEVYEAFLKANFKNLFADGLHPNSRGHQKIFELAKSCLLENKLINSKE